MKQRKKMKEYKILFYTDKCNWVSLSSISKKDLDAFIEYLYSLTRDINVFPYISGGGPFGNPYLDRTYVVRGIANDIKKKVPIDKVLNKYISRDESEQSYFGIHFIEDVYEFYLSLGIDEKIAFSAAKSQYNCENIKKYLMVGEFEHNEKLKAFAEWRGNDYTHYPYQSRWVFIYMFRNEFKKYMHDKGFRVVVDGGWVLNDKNREIKLGLIDENGELF